MVQDKMLTAITPSTIDLAGDRSGVGLSATNAPVEGASIVAVHHHPVSGGASALVRRIIPALSEHARRIFVEMSQEQQTALREQRQSPLFKIELKELRQLIEDSSKDSQRIYEAINAIYQFDVQWESVGYDSEGKLVTLSTYRSRIISTWGKGVNERNAVIQYEMPHQVLMFMLENKAKAQIDLRANNELGSSYAIALYDICARYMNTNTLLTPEWTVQEWIAKTAGEGRYNDEYKQFNRFVLKPALKRMEQTVSCPFTVEPIEIKGPHQRVTHLQMRLIPKKQVGLGMDLGPLTWSRKTMEQLEGTYGFNKEELVRLSISNTEAEILEAIKRDRLLDEQKTGSQNASTKRSAFLVALLHNVHNGMPRGAQPIVQDKEENPILIEARKQAQLQRQQFESHLGQRVYERLSYIPKARLTSLSTQFKTHLRKAGTNELATAQTGDISQAPTDNNMQRELANWIAVTHPEVCKQIIPNEEDRDFGSWLILEQTRKSMKP